MEENEHVIDLRIERRADGEMIIANLGELVAISERDTEGRHDIADLIIELMLVDLAHKYERINPIDYYMSFVVTGPKNRDHIPKILANALKDGR